MRIFLITFLINFCFQSKSQNTITYQLDLSHIQHHELGIKVLFTALDKDTLEIHMPNTSPGRYAIHNFAKNVYNESATDPASGEKITLIRSTPFIWKVPLKGKSLIFEYTLYGNHADGTYTGIDASKLHLNMPATFIYGKGLADRKINLIINTDNPDWSVATQLNCENDSTFSAPNYYYFYDSPILVGEISWRKWQVDDQTIEVAMIHDGNDQELDSYVSWIKRIVNQEMAVFGELPDFDFGRYTFLCVYNPWAVGDAMEHRNSTVCSSEGNLAHHAPYLIGSISHEFFHSWNIERIRPKSLEPFNFDAPNLSGELWFGEGFTNYYDELSLCRAGIITQEKFLNTAQIVLNNVMNAPGRAIRTPIEMSHNAIFVDAGTANDETNYQNNFISYYTYGEMLGLALDLSIRSKFPKLTLDDYMKLVWIKYGKTEQPYTLLDLRVTLAEITKDRKFTDAFFDQYIHQSNLPNFEILYKNVGITMSISSPGKIYTGKVQLNKEGVITSALIKGTALYEAGLNKGDRILSLNGIELNSIRDFELAINDMKLDQSYAITYEQIGKLKSSKFLAKQDPDIKLAFDEKASKTIMKNRGDWLEAK
jgi:predicted metalloprotease with PDZ domain